MLLIPVSMNAVMSYLDMSCSDSCVFFCSFHRCLVDQQHLAYSSCRVAANHFDSHKSTVLFWTANKRDVLRGLLLIAELLVETGCAIVLMHGRSV